MLIQTSVSKVPSATSPLFIGPLYGCTGETAASTGCAGTAIRITEATRIIARAIEKILDFVFLLKLAFNFLSPHCLRSTLFFRKSVYLLYVELQLTVIKPSGKWALTTKS